VSAAACRLGVTSRTLRRYTAEGRLPDVGSAGNRRIFQVGDPDRLTSKRSQRKAAGYARVSSRRQWAEGDPEVARLVAGHPGRLARFGTGLTGHLPAGCGVNVTCTGQPEDETTETELVRDMPAIVTSFAGRLYGQLPAKTRRPRAAVAAEARSGDAA
jgi:predicted site-specific integrase-resolvase